MPIKVKVGLVPFQDANYWGVIVMNDDNLYHYDMLKSTNIFHLLVLRHFFAKIWVVKESKLSKTNEWKQVVSKLDSAWWIAIGVKLECGFYVIKFITKFYEWMTNEKSICLHVFLWIRISHLFILNYQSYL